MKTCAVQLKFGLGFLCCLCAGLVFGQDSLSTNIALPKVTHLGVEDGLPTRTVIDIVQDQQGFIWLSTEVGICRYDGYRFVPLRDLLPKGTEIPRRPFRLYTYPPFLLLLADHQHKKTWTYDLNTNHLQALQRSQKQTDSLYHILDQRRSQAKIFQDTRGYEWSLGKGLFRTDSCGEQQNYSNLIRRENPFSGLSKIIEDRQHRIWITSNNGILSFSNETPLFINYLHHAQPKWGKQLRGIFSDHDGHIYARVTDRGHSMEDSYYRIDLANNTSTPFPLRTTQQVGRRTLIQTRYYYREPAGDTVWTINSRGLFAINLDEQSLKIYEEEEQGLLFIKPGLRAWTFMAPHYFIIGTHLDQLYAYDFQRHQARKMPIPDTLSGSFRLMTIGQDSMLWIGTRTDGVYGVDLKDQRLRYAFTPARFPQLSSPSITTLCPLPDGTVWAGTATGGLLHLLPQQSRIEIYTTTNGLANDQVMEILPYGENYLLISTYYGLSLLELSTRTFRNFYEEDGLAYNEFNVSSSFIDQSGRYYFGGLNGMSSFDPADLLHPIQQPAPLMLTSFSAFDVSKDSLIAKEAGLGQLKKINLNPYISWFQLEFALADYASPRLNQFKVWLEGYQSTWEDLGTQPMIRYNDLPAGRYTLHIAGANTKGFWSEDTLKIQLIVQQVFYKSWWFIVLCALALLSIAYAFLRYRFRQKLARERLRTQIAGDLHDEIGSSLSYINLFVHSLDIKGQPDHIVRGIQRSREIVNKTVSNIRDVVWAIDAGRDTLGDMLDRMEDFALDMLQTKGVSYQLEVDHLQRTMILNPIVRQNTYLIFKEAINNIIRHSNASQVTIILSCRQNKLLLSIQDNGTTISTTKGSGLGLDHMRLRAKRMHGQVQIQQNENGFLVKVEAPLRADL